MPSPDGGDDFVRVLGPGKGLWVCIGMIEETVDGVFEFLQGAEDAAFEPFLGEVGEEAFNSIEPRCRCRGEVEDEAWMVGDPFQHVGVLVSGIIVDNDMDSLLLRHSGIG